MNKKDREEMVGLVTDALSNVVVPALDAMETRLKEELLSKKEFNQRIDSFDRKLDAQEERLDRHDKRVETLEKIHPKGKHLLAAS